jgi:hypothetical protein
VTLQHDAGLLLARFPDRDARVGAGGNDAAVAQQRDGIHRAIMEAQDLFGRVGLERPADGRCIETAGDRLRTVGGNRQGPHRPAMAAHLRLYRRGGKHESGEKRQSFHGPTASSTIGAAGDCGEFDARYI